MKSEDVVLILWGRCKVRGITQVIRVLYMGMSALNLMTIQNKVEIFQSRRKRWIASLT